MKQIESLNFARVVAMLAVILIHVTSTYIYCESNFLFLGMNLAFFLNQVSRFSVPLFFLLSGTSLGLGKKQTGIWNFYQRRLYKIGIPYLFWFVIYYFSRYSLTIKTIKGIFRAFLLGQGAPHLYFIVILFQLYLIYPFLQKRVRASAWREVLLSFFITYSMQKLRLLQLSGIDILPKAIQPYLWILFPTWLFYFTMGQILTKDRLKYIFQFSQENKILILFATAVFIILYASESTATGLIDSMKSSLNIIVPFVLLSIFVVWEIIGKYMIIQRVTALLSRHSLTIYFEHIFVLRFFRNLPFFESGMFSMLLLYVVVVIASIIVAILIDTIIQTTKRFKSEKYK